MSYNVDTISTFRREAKKLIRKYPSLKKELEQLIENLSTDPTQGTSLGKNCYKLRLAIASKNTGKSGGARIITHIVVAEDTVYLLSIYDKSDKDTLTDKQIIELLDSIPD